MGKNISSDEEVPPEKEESISGEVKFNAGNEDTSSEEKPVIQNTNQYP